MAATSSTIKYMDYNVAVLVLVCTVQVTHVYWGLLLLAHVAEGVLRGLHGHILGLEEVVVVVVSMHAKGIGLLGLAWLLIEVVEVEVLLRRLLLLLLRRLLLLLLGRLPLVLGRLLRRGSGLEGLLRDNNGGCDVHVISQEVETVIEYLGVLLLRLGDLVLIHVGSESEVIVRRGCFVIDFGLGEVTEIIEAFELSGHCFEFVDLRLVILRLFHF